MPSGAATAAHLVVVGLDLGARLVEVGEGRPTVRAVPRAPAKPRRRRASARSGCRDRDRLPAVAGDPFQQSRECRPARRRGAVVGAAEAEFFVFGADRELVARLAARGDLFRQLADRPDRRRVGFSGIGHLVPVCVPARLCAGPDRKWGRRCDLLAAADAPRQGRLQQRQPDDRSRFGAQDARTERGRHNKGTPAARRQAPRR